MLMREGRYSAASLLLAALAGAAVASLIAGRTRDVQDKGNLKEGQAKAVQAKADRAKKDRAKEDKLAKGQAKNKNCSGRQQRLSPELNAEAHFVRPRLPEGKGPRRTILCQDVKVWLDDQGEFPEGMSVIASIPDISELFEKLSIQQYKEWFEYIATSVLQKLQPGQCAVFYQSDIRSTRMVGRDKRCEELVHKVGLAANASLQVPGTKLWWHKIVSYAPLDNGKQVMGVGRPQLSHIVCYGKSAPGAAENVNVGEARAKEPASLAALAMGTYDARTSLSPDIMWRGAQLWERGMGVQATHMIADFLKAKDQPAITSIACLFCGVGTAPAMVNAVGLDAVGVDLCAARCEKARTLEFSLTELVADRVKNGTMPAPRERKPKKKKIKQKKQPKQEKQEKQEKRKKQQLEQQLA